MLKNYKTTISGALMLIAVGLFWQGAITLQQFETGLAALTAAGLFAAKDHDNNTTPPTV